MTPGEVRSLSLHEYLAFAKVMDDSRKDQERALKKARKR